MISYESREKFVNEMLIKLEMNNYGFTDIKKINKKNDIKIDDTIDTFTVFDITQMKAIKELQIRLNVWKITGKLDKGEIDFPEAKRKIIYNFSDINIEKCKLYLLKT